MIDRFIYLQVMRSREIAPLKPPDVDLDLRRFTTTNHHYETPINRKF